MTSKQVEDVWQSGVLLAVGIILLLVIYWCAGFILSHVGVIFAVLAATGFGIWRWVYRRS